RSSCPIAYRASSARRRRPGQTSSDERRLLVLGRRLANAPRRTGRRCRGPIGPALKNSSGCIAAAETEGEGGRNCGRAQDQAKGEDHDLVGKPHEGEADRGEQG